MQLIKNKFNMYSNYQVTRQTRKERTLTFQKIVEKEWQAKYLEFVKPYMSNPLFNWYSLSSNPNINPQFIFDNPQYPWEIDKVCQRPDISIETVIERYGNLGVDLWFNLLYRDDVKI